MACGGRNWCSIIIFIFIIKKNDVCVCVEKNKEYMFEKSTG